jgi:hypothetical protein
VGLMTRAASCRALFCLYLPLLALSRTVFGSSTKHVMVDAGRVAVAKGQSNTRTGLITAPDSAAAIASLICSNGNV